MFNRQTPPKTAARRIIIDALIFLGIFVAPLWTVGLTAALCVFIFENFYEIVIAAILVDALYGIPTSLFATPFIYTLSAALLFIAINLLKRHLRF